MTDRERKEINDESQEALVLKTKGNYWRWNQQVKLIEDSHKMESNWPISKSLQII